MVQLRSVFMLVGLVVAAATSAAAQSVDPIGWLKDQMPVQGFVAVAGSMEPTIAPRDYLRADQTKTALSSIKRGDIIVFRTPSGDHFVKRVIGLPGETIAMRGGVPLIDGVPLRQSEIGPYELADQNPWNARFETLIELEETGPEGGTWRVLEWGDRTTPLDEMAPTSIPEGMYFVLGDFRDNSVDSRVASTGVVPKDKVIGVITDITPPRE